MSVTPYTKKLAENERARPVFEDFSYNEGLSAIDKIPLVLAKKHPNGLHKPPVVQVIIRNPKYLSSDFT
jgi:hypothetical protein